MAGTHRRVNHAPPSPWFHILIVGFAFLGLAFILELILAIKLVSFLTLLVEHNPKLLSSLEESAYTAASIAPTPLVTPRSSDPANTGGQTPAPKKSTMTVFASIPYWDQARAFSSFQTHVTSIDYLSLFWYRLDPAGTIRTYDETEEDTAIIDFAHRNTVRVFGLVANLPDFTEGGTWDPARVWRVIETPETRRNHVSALVTLAEEKNFDGIHIDYEALPGEYRTAYTQFIQGLGNALHARGKMLAVALHPKTSETNPAEDNGSHAQDWKAIAPFVDQMHLMTYSEHELEGVPGPAASPEMITEVLAYAIEKNQLPREKIFFGVPFYGQEWAEPKPRAYRGIHGDRTFADVQTIRSRFKTTEFWHEPSKTPYLRYAQKGEERIIWFENQKSVAAKLELAKKFGATAISLWRIGGEDPAIWKIIETLRRSK
ncbi:MAG: hypothetical protein HY460_01235 [Parcubacteria group bacterium]|nr:hypothetical protein [Parcubacteria group bacterium]